MTDKVKKHVVSKFFGISTKTLYNWKKNKIEGRENLYKASLLYYDLANNEDVADKINAMQYKLKTLKNGIALLRNGELDESVLDATMESSVSTVEMLEEFLQLLTPDALDDDNKE